MENDRISKELQDIAKEITALTLSVKAVQAEPRSEQNEERR